MRYKLDLLKAPAVKIKSKKVEVSTLRAKTSGRPIPCPLGGDESEGSDKIINNKHNETRNSTKSKQYKKDA